MARASALTAHLPALYRDGATVDGFNQLWGVELDMLDEAARQVQRAHWFDATPDLDEAAALGALLDIAPEEFHADIGEYRAWVHAMTAARLRAGAVTREALRILVDTYAEGFQRAADVELVPPIRAWAREPDDGPALVEQPRRFRSARLPVSGGWEPLARLDVVNAGIDPAVWAVVITGLPDASEFAPLVANRTTGHAVVYRGRVPVGARLTIAPRADDRATFAADLDGRDVSEHLDTYEALVPGPAGPGERSPADLAPRLARGTNELWFLPLAHYDTPGLDRFLLAFAEDSLRQGRFDETTYDAALFAQDPRMAAWVAWVEAAPAALEIRLPGQVMQTAAGQAASGLAARERLEQGLDVAVDRLAGAGIAADVVLTGHHERQPSRDRLAAIFPLRVTETGPTGRDGLVDAGALYDVTEFDDSVLR